LLEANFDIKRRQTCRGLQKDQRDTKLFAAALAAQGGQSSGRWIKKSGKKSYVK